MKVKMILPALTEAKSPFWRPIKYSLFPPLGLATLAAYVPDAHDEEELSRPLALDEQEANALASRRRPPRPGALAHRARAPGPDHARRRLRRGEPEG